MMGELVAKGPGLSDLARRIDEEHEAATTSLGNAFDHARTAGELLLQAKKGCPHSGWLPWLEANCKVSARMAQNYMRLARELPKLKSNTKRVADLSLREALAAISRQTAKVAKLPPPIVSVALEEKTDADKIGALKRAEAIQELRKSQAKRAEIAAQSGAKPGWTTVTLRREPTPEEIAAAKARENLTQRVKETVLAWWRDHRDVPAELICDALNDVYCGVQDGGLELGQ